MAFLIDEIKMNCYSKIDELLAKYKDNDYMMQRMQTHVVNYLPNSLENELKNHIKRKDRNNYLINEQQLFIQVFLTKNQYYYLHTNNGFYQYDGTTYYAIKEDDILHKLLSSISQDRKLLQWKYKTKINVLKQIKDRNLFSSIPETDTIQNVLNLIYPSIFPSKNHAKYFLTIIGDNIFKKKSNLIFLVSTTMKKLISVFDDIVHMHVGNYNIGHNFITKYHDTHSYENCRLLNMNDKFSFDIWNEILKQKGLDLLCVSAHYSNRYENSDNFILSKADDDLKLYVNYLKNNSQEYIVNEFLESRIKFVQDPNAKIDWKHIHFIWKQFLSSKSIPNIIYSNTLKSFIKNIKASYYDEANDCLISHTSLYLPIESDFIKFWDNTIVLTSDNEYGENELELDEICMLFKNWAKNNASLLSTNGNISEENVLKILKHFFPNIEIVEDKYIMNIACSLWNKNKDIEECLEFIKNKLQNQYMLALISIDEIYSNYYNCCDETGRFVVSKSFFEKYIYSKYTQHIVYEKFVETEFFLA